VSPVRDLLSSEKARCCAAPIALSGFTPLFLFFLHSEWSSSAALPKPIASSRPAVPISRSYVAMQEGVRPWWLPAQMPCGSVLVFPLQLALFSQQPLIMA